MYVERVCRACLSEYDELTPLGANLSGSNKTVKATINFIVNFNISLEDGLPNKICKDCKTELESADNFKQRFLESEAILCQRAKELWPDKTNLKYSNNQQTNNGVQMKDNNSRILTITSTDSSQETCETENNICDSPEHEIKMKIFHEQTNGRNLDTIQSKEHCFIKEINLEKNKKQSFNKEIFSCDHCNLTFQTKISYKVHMLCGHEPNDLKQFICDLCNKTFNSKHHIKVHMRTHNKQTVKKIDSKKFACKNCDREFITYLGLKKHNTDCSYKKYGRDFPSRETLQPYRLERRKDSSCPKKSKSDDIQPTEVTFTVEKQTADFFTATIIETEGDFDKVEHSGIIKKKSNEKQLKFKINKGPKSKLNKTNKESIKKIINITKNLDKKSDDKMITEKQLKCLKLLNTSALKMLTCDICEYTTDRIRNLNSHLKAHAATKRYSCEFCPYLTVRPCCYRDHATTHTFDKPYSCPLCEKKYTLRSYLARHIKTHTGKKSYACDICEQKFHDRSNLRVHKRTHTGEKPFSCNVCEKKFCRRKILEDHLKIHAGIIPYSCDICEKGFLYRNQIIRHLRLHQSS